MSTKRFTCGAPSASAKAARSSMSVSGPNVEKRMSPSAVSARAASAKTREGSHHCRARFEKTSSTEALASGRRSASAHTSAGAGRPACAATIASERGRARASPARCRSRRRRPRGSASPARRRHARCRSRDPRRGGAPGGSGRGARGGARTPRAAVRPPRRRSSRPARRRGARGDFTGSSVSSMQGLEGARDGSVWLTKGRCAPSGISTKRANGSAPASQRPAPTGARARRALPWITAAGRSITATSSRRSASCRRASPAARESADGVPRSTSSAASSRIRSRAVRAAQRVQVHEGANRLRGLVAKALRESLQRLARPSRAASRRAGRSRAWCSRGPASRRARGWRVARRIATSPPRDQPHTSDPSGTHSATASTTASSPPKAVPRECPWPGRSTRWRRNDAREPLRASACHDAAVQSPPVQQHEIRAAAERSTCSAIAKDLAQCRGQRQDLFTRMRRRKRNAKPAVPSGTVGGRIAGTSWPRSRRRAESPPRARSRRRSRAGWPSTRSSRRVGAHARRNVVDAIIAACATSAGSPSTRRRPASRRPPPRAAAQSRTHTCVRVASATRSRVAAPATNAP